MKTRGNTSRRSNAEPIERFVQRLHAERGTAPRATDAPVSMLVPIDAPRRAVADNERFAAEMRQAGGWIPGLPRIVVADFGDRLVILDGHHRYRAAKKADLGTVPVIVIDGAVYRQAAREYGVNRYGYIEGVLPRLYPVVARNLATRKGAVGAPPVDYRISRPTPRRIGEGQLLEILRGGEPRGVYELPELIDPQVGTVETSDGQRFDSLRHWLGDQIKSLPIAARILGGLVAVEMILPVWQEWMDEQHTVYEHEALLQQVPGYGEPYRFDYIRWTAYIVERALPVMEVGAQQRPSTENVNLLAQQGLDWLGVWFYRARGILGRTMTPSTLWDRSWSGPWFAGFRAAYSFTRAAAELEQITFSNLFGHRALAVSCISNCGFGQLLVGARRGLDLQSAEYTENERLNDAYHVVFDQNIEGIRPFLAQWWQRFQVRFPIREAVPAKSRPDPEYERLVERWGSLDSFPEIVMRGTEGDPDNPPSYEFDDQRFIEWDVWTDAQPWAVWISENVVDSRLARPRDDQTIVLIDNRYIVDPSRRHMDQQPEFVFDAEDPVDASRVISIYGDPARWMTFAWDRFFGNRYEGNVPVPQGLVEAMQRQILMPGGEV